VLLISFFVAFTNGLIMIVKNVIVSKAAINCSLRDDNNSGIDEGVQYA